jgi:hypothetical protein
MAFLLQSGKEILLMNIGLGEPNWTFMPPRQPGPSRKLSTGQFGARILKQVWLIYKNLSLSREY